MIVGGFLAAVLVTWPAGAQMLTGYDDTVPAEQVPEGPVPQIPVSEPAAQPITLQPLQSASSAPSKVKAKDAMIQMTKGAFLTGVTADTDAEAGKGSADPNRDGAPVDLTADKLEHDEATQTITASGDVFLEQSGRILRADQISYNLQTDTVVASGHVVLNQENDDIYYSDKLVLKDQLKDGFVKGLKTYLRDGSRFSAAEGSRKGGTVTTMKDASYTPCEPCKAHPEKPPVWQIVASDVTHDDAEHRVSYKNARFEAWGVPIAYTPYFSHPDGSIKRKSGFLSPTGGFKSRLGAFIENQYYWSIAPDKDATIGLTAMTEEDPLLTGQWRQRWDNAEMQVDGGITNSSRVDSIGDTEIVQDKEVRGHVIGHALWDVNDTWRAGVNTQWASDDQYMRQYNITHDNVLENEVYAERFSGRNYTSARMLKFQDVRVREDQVDQPNVLPEIFSSFIGEPGAVPLLKGRWSVQGSALGLQRSGGQDMTRLSATGGWKRRLVSDYGLLTTVNADLRGDLYHVRDRDVATLGSGLSKNSTKARIFPSFNAKTSYPLVRPFEKMQAVIEPTAALTVVPNIDVSDAIPNEDSQDSQLDAGNLFEPNRFPGLDRIEDKSRATYGLRAGLYGYEGSYGDVFVGQSYRFDDDDNPFPVGSGLDRQQSDFVGQVSAAYRDRYDLSYRFQLDSESLASQRHEVDASANWARLNLSTRYLFAEGLKNTDVSSGRQQVQMSAGYYMTPEWRTRLGGTYDFTDDEESGLRKAFVGLDYFGQCVSLFLTGVRSLTDESSGDSNTEILFRIGLKNLGEFEESGYRRDKDRP